MHWYMNLLSALLCSFSLLVFQCVSKPLNFHAVVPMVPVGLQEEPWLKRNFGTLHAMYLQTLILIDIKLLPESFKASLETTAQPSSSLFLRLERICSQQLFCSGLCACYFAQLRLSKNCDFLYMMGLSVQTHLFYVGITHSNSKKM